MNDDQRLHDAFQASRVAERAEAPPFARVLAGRRPKPRRDAAPALIAAWRSPTDFLLPASAPGLLSSVPRIGEAPAGSPLQALDPGGTLGPPVLSRSPRS
jgi:hypothetical protein